MAYQKAADPTKAPQAGSAVARALIEEHLDEQGDVDDQVIGAGLSSSDSFIIAEGALAMQSAKEISHRLSTTLR